MTYPKVRRCCVPGCSSRDDIHPHPVFHLVPQRNIKHRKIWLKLIGLKKSLQKRQLFVCQKHFEKRFISEEKKRMKYGFPTLITQEEVETGISKRLPNGEILINAVIDHSYCLKPDELAPDHSYSVPVQPSFENVLYEESEAEDTDTDIDETEIELPKPRKRAKRKKQSPLGTAKRPLYYIHDNKENNTEDNDNPNIPNIIIFDNNTVDDNSKNNDNNTTPNFIVVENEVNVSTNVDNIVPDIITLGNIPVDNNSSLLKLLVDNELINKIEVDDNVIDNDAVNDGDYDDDVNHFDPNMVIDLTPETTDNIDNNAVTDGNPDAHDNVEVVDSNVVIENIVQNNLSNEQMLENIMTEIKTIKTNLNDTIKTTNIVGYNKDLTEKLDMNDMALINYNNTVVLCRKSEVAELKTNYPDLVAQNDQMDQNLVTPVKRHSIRRRRRRKKLPTELNKHQEAQKESITVETEDQQAVKHILCACDVNSPCEHRDPQPNVLVNCDICKEEHPINYWFCKRNQKPRPKKISSKRRIGNRDRRRRYITVDQFEQVNNNIQNLMSTTQQIQGQINSLTSVLTSVVTAVSTIEKERELKKPKPRKPRNPRKKKEKESLPIL